MDATIFKKNDIRGTASGDAPQITAPIARAIGLAFGTYLQRLEQKDRVVVGRDNRRSSYTLSRAVIEGLRASGCHTTDIDLVPTPVVYWNAVRRGDIGGVMVTGSHLSPDQNGFKLTVGNRNLFGSQIQLLRGFIEANDLTYGSGGFDADHSSYIQYTRDVSDRIRMARPLKVVVDAGNGMGGLFTPSLLRNWGHDLLTCLYCQPDGDFPNHPANPQEAANLRDLSAKVVELGADIGIAFDGDVDRIGVVDERGQIIAADRLLMLMALDMLTRNPGATVVADVLSSQVLFDEIGRAGGKPVMWATGHSLIKSRMRETRALLGGEVSGHIFLSEDYYGFDDGLFAAGRVLQLLANSDQPLSALDAALPRLYATPEYRPYCPDSAKYEVVSGVRQALADKGEITTIDGVRIRFERGWGIIRASNTEPVLSLRFEGETEADALAYRDLFAEALSAYPQVGRLV